MMLCGFLGQEAGARCRDVAAWGDQSGAAPDLNHAFAKYGVKQHNPTLSVQYLRFSWVGQNLSCVQHYPNSNFIC